MKWSLDRTHDPASGNGTLVSSTVYLKQIDTPDRYTVVLNFAQPWPAVFDVLETINIIDPQSDVKARPVDFDGAGGLELILSFPLVSLVMAIYFSLAYKDDSAVQRPEGLYAEPALMTAVTACAALMVVLLFVNVTCKLSGKTKLKLTCAVLELFNGKSPSSVVAVTTTLVSDSPRWPFGP